MERFTTAFDRVAERQGAQVAIQQDRTRQCLYSELLGLACEIEQMIVALGIPSQSVICIEIEKSIEFVACLIGVWRAECVAMPMTDAIPIAVRRDNCRRAAVAATLRLDPRSPAGVRLQSDPSSRSESKADVHASDLLSETPFDHLAYLFYTSGSTGRPKGVAVTHRGLVPVLRDQIRIFGLNDHTRSLFYLSIGFDASLSDIGTALLSGGTLVMDSDIATLAVPELLQRMQQQQITYADLPPAIVARAASLKLELPSSLSTVVIGGERCAQSGIDWFSQRVNLFNVYGPTEATICTSIKACEAGRSPSIGIPIAGMRYQLQPLDRNSGSDADGVQDEGELWIAGPGLAAGYLADPVLTDQRFVWQADDQGQRSRWYRTGDLVRRDPAGEFVFLGRIDHQFKLLGKLVEPEHILHHLLNQPGVADAAIVPLWQDHGSARAICAVVVPVDGIPLDAALLRRRLHETLPAWMVPTLIQFATEIPKTVTGKTDLATVVRSVVPSDTRIVTDDDSQHRFDTKKLCKIWIDVLGHDEFSWDDTLATAGGSSLAALEILAQAESAGLILDPARLQHQRLRECVLESGVVDRMTSKELSEITSHLATSLPSLPRIEFDRTGQRQILLTGATGFLGTWVLEELLRRESERTVHCLVRGQDPTHAIERLCNSRSRFLGSSNASLNTSQVRIVCGDICKPNFGLPDSDWFALSDQITDIVHLAARVHLLDDFDSLRSSNLDSLVEMVRLANAHAPKALHYASTLSVFVATDREESCFMESDRLHSCTQIYGGYGQTKWAAEDLIWRIAGQQEPSIYRFGLLTGDSQHGIGPSHDQLAMFTRGIVHLQCFPKELSDACFDVTPVDDAARALVQLLDHRCTGAFHLCGPMAVRLSRWINAICRSGFVVQPVSMQQFTQAVRDFHDKPSRPPEAVLDVAAASLAVRYRGDADSHSAVQFPIDRQGRALDLFQATNKRFDASRTIEALQDTGIQIRPISDQELTRMAMAMIEPSCQERE